MGLADDLEELAVASEKRPYAAPFTHAIELFGSKRALAIADDLGQPKWWYFTAFVSGEDAPARLREAAKKARGQ